MGAQKISLDQARDILEHLEEALTLLDIAGQHKTSAHVQLAIDLFRASTDIEATSSCPLPDHK